MGACPFLRHLARFDEKILTANRDHEMCDTQAHGLDRDS
jgi:hypothetical protein